MTQNGIWLKKGLVPYHLNASELALALLVREKPLSAQQLSAALTEKGIRLDRKQLGKILAKYSESQLLDIVGLTQHTVNGQAVFSGTPPMSISSRGSSGV